MFTPISCPVCRHITSGSFTLTCSRFWIAYGEPIQSIASQVSQTLTCHWTKRQYFDPGCSGVDALAQLDWAEHNNFVNPSFHLIARILQIIPEQQAVTTLLAPWWPAQPWFRTLQQLCTRQPLQIPNRRHMFLPTGSIPEPLHNHAWKLYPWQISEKKK